MNHAFAADAQEMYVAPKIETLYPSTHDGYDYYTDDAAILEEYVSIHQHKANDVLAAYGDWYDDAETDQILAIGENVLNAASVDVVDSNLNRLGYWVDVANSREEEAERQRQAAIQKREASAAQSYSSSGSGLTKSSGVNYHNGTRETYYSSNVLYHYRTSEWHADGEGFYRTSDGYYVVASSDHPQGTVIQTSKGAAMVLDSGCASGTVDFYTCW